jgi:hypothetical protein
MVKLKETSLSYWNLSIRNLVIPLLLSVVSEYFASQWKINVIMTKLKLHKKTRWMSEIIPLRINGQVTQIQLSTLAESWSSGLCFRVTLSKTIPSNRIWEREREVAVWISCCYKGTHPPVYALLLNVALKLNLARFISVASQLSAPYPNRQHIHSVPNIRDWRGI